MEIQLFLVNGKSFPNLNLIGLWGSYTASKSMVPGYDIQEEGKQVASLDVMFSMEIRLKYCFCPVKTLLYDLISEL